MTPNCPERPFEDALLKLAITLGWRVHAERPAPSRRDGDEGFRTHIKGHRGFPDIVLAHPDHGLIVAELKTARGRLGPGQQEWQDDLVPLDRPGSKVLIELWRPADWSAIELALTEGFDAYRTRYRKPPNDPVA